VSVQRMRRKDEGGTRRTSNIRHLSNAKRVSQTGTPTSFTQAPFLHPSSLILHPLPHMATPGRRIDLATRNQIARLLVVRCPRRYIAHLCRVCKRTVDKVASEEGTRRSASSREPTPAIDLGEQTKLIYQDSAGTIQMIVVPESNLTAWVDVRLEDVAKRFEHSYTIG
jgi:hypothetical protein